MHRKVKGLLSLVLTFAMVTASVAPVSADELSGKEQQPAEELPIVETAEIQIETEPAGEEPAAETALEEQSMTEVQSVAESLSEEPAAEETESVEQTTQEAKPVLDSYSESDLDDLYNTLSEEQKKFNVYSGNQPLSEIITGTDILSKLVFEGGGVTPDASDLDSQSGALIKAILAKREGDLNFYRLARWNVWKVSSDGIPESIIASRASLGRLATVSNFKQAAYLAKGGIGTAPVTLFMKPILEPVWSCLDFAIPVYDSNGNDTGTTITVNAENYNDSSQVFFPELEADSWKLVYNGTEYSLNAASEIWTNETNGIRTIGRDFDVSQARIQADVLSVPEEDKYEISGEQGNEGWYKGAVTIQAKAGYQVRLSEAEVWSDAVSVTESGDVTLFLKKSDGAELPAETLHFLIDQTNPVIAGVMNGETYYGDGVAVVVTDEHLHTVTVNGGAVGVFDNRADIMLRPSEEPYIISAGDMAGNRIECIVWVKKAEIPPALKEGTAEFMQPDWYEGQPKPDPVVSSETNGIEHITYYYKEAGADDSAYTMIQPGKAGAYTAKAVFAATEEYQEVIKTADFHILPIQPVLQEGTAEFTQSGWYEDQPKPDPVVSSETNGTEHITYYYKEQGADDSTYTTTVPDKAGKYTAKAVFAATEKYLEVIRTSDFEILPSVPAVDDTAPVIDGVSNGQIYYGDQAVTVTDTNLRTVTVNDETVKLIDNHADITLKPSEDLYKIIAIDEAGNRTECTVEVLETWVRDGINDNGKKKLRRERLYKLGSGQWTVDGDSTVYSGGAFYVKNGGEYDFTRK